MEGHITLITHKLFLRVILHTTYMTTTLLALPPWLILTIAAVWSIDS